jgi:hypothetical protein
LYDVDKVIFIGGGNPPTANAEIIDFSQAQPAWQATDPMNFPAGSTTPPSSRTERCW